MNATLVFLLILIAIIAETLLIIDAHKHKSEWQINFMEEYRSYIRDQKEAKNV